MRYVALDGEMTSTQRLRGNVVYVVFWATSCVTCVKEMPDLVKTYERYAPRGFELLAVAMTYDPPQYVANFAREHRLPFKVVLDKAAYRVGETASLDPHAKREVEQLMEDFASGGMTLVFASHNLGQVKRIATRVVYLEQGRVLADLPVREFFEGPLGATSREADLFVRGELG